MTDTLYDRVVAAIGHQYELESEIGRGGMSVVYRARDIRLNRTVAVKVLPPELAYDPAIRTRFTREAQTAARLTHAHIVPIYDVGERDGIAYFVMALITGGNLAALLAHEPRQPIDEARRLLVEIADALSYAHLRGVIHRDIKPDNILLDAESGRAMVSDFGIARAIESGTQLTITGTAVGTPTYMSPEQAVGEKELDGRSDLYSLGVVAYQMLTGRVPFAAGNSMALLMKHVSERPQPIVDLRPDVPKALRDAVERALMKAPEDRWPTAASLRDALRSDDAPAMWRAEYREPVRYTSPRPESARRRRGAPVADGRQAAPPPAPNRSPAGILLEPEHLVSLTPEQRKDLRLWGGRVHVLERIKAFRGYAWLTLAGITFGFVGFGVGVSDMPPLVLAPIVPWYMTVKLMRRGRSLREHGLRLRHVLMMPNARLALRGPRPISRDRYLQKLAPREVLDSPYGAAIRRASEERALILDIVAKLPKADRALLPDVAPAVKGLLERVANLAQIIHRLDPSIDTRAIADLNEQITEVERDKDSTEAQRRLALLHRQRATFEELVQRRASLLRQLDNAGLALANLRLDLIKFRSSGPSALSDVSTATQEAQALSRDIATALEAAAEVKSL
jgi:serine/threonine protein kinase